MITLNEKILNRIIIDEIRRDTEQGKEPLNRTIKSLMGDTLSTNGTDFGDWDELSPEEKMKAQFRTHSSAPEDNETKYDKLLGRNPMPTDKKREMLQKQLQYGEISLKDYREAIKKLNAIDKKLNIRNSMARKKTERISRKEKEAELEQLRQKEEKLKQEEKEARLKRQKNIENKILNNLQKYDVSEELLNAIKNSINICYEKEITLTNIKNVVFTMLDRQLPESLIIDVLKYYATNRRFKANEFCNRFYWCDITKTNYNQIFNHMYMYMRSRGED